MDSKVKLFQALANFQQEVPAIHEATKGYGYTYANLTQILNTINPLLKKHGLGFTQLLNGNSINTIIFHCESGATIESTVELPSDVVLKGMNKFQVTGSAITYYRRYSLSSILGLVTDVDADGAGEQLPKAPKKTAIQEARPTTDKKWLTPEEFEKAKTFAASDLKKLLTHSVKYKLRPEQKIELERIYNESNK